MRKKFYEEPEMDIEICDLTNIITASVEDDNEHGWGRPY